MNGMIKKTFKVIATDVIYKKSSIVECKVSKNMHM
jgi:hypothetical protein